MANRTHSRFALSSCSRWGNCAGSVALNEKYPQQTSEAAQEGRDAHSVCEEALKNIFYHQVSKEVAITKALSNKPGLSKERQMIEDAVNYTIKIYEETINPVVTLEKRVGLANIHPELFGTADVIIVGDGYREKGKEKMVPTAHVIDFKFGKLVEVKDSSQICGYALGFLDAQEPINRVIGHIIQPRLCGDMPKTKLWKFDQHDLEEFSEFLKQGVKLAQTTGLLETGPWCDYTFCGARAICPAYQKELLDDIAGEEELFDVATLSDEAIRERFLNIKKHNKYIRILTKFIEDRLAGGSPNHQLGLQQIDKKHGERLLPNAENSPSLIARDDIWVLKSAAKIRELVTPEQYKEITEPKYIKKIINIRT